MLLWAFDADIRELNRKTQWTHLPLREVVLQSCLKSESDVRNLCSALAAASIAVRTSCRILNWGLGDVLRITHSTTPIAQAFWVSLTWSHRNFLLGLFYYVPTYPKVLQWNPSYSSFDPRDRHGHLGSSGLATPVCMEKVEDTRSFRLFIQRIPRRVLSILEHPKTSR